MHGQRSPLVSTLQWQLLGLGGSSGESAIGHGVFVVDQHGRIEQAHHGMSPRRLNRARCFMYAFAARTE